MFLFAFSLIYFKQYYVLCSIFMFYALEFLLASECINYQLRIWFGWAFDSLPPFIDISVFALDKNSHDSRNFLSCKWKSCTAFTVFLYICHLVKMTFFCFCIFWHANWIPWSLTWILYCHFLFPGSFYSFEYLTH